MTEPFRVQGVQTTDKRFLRAGIWDVPEGTECRGICVLLQGMTEFLEKYGDVASELAARGFIVASCDWRGQGASERRGAGNRAVHVKNFEEYDSDLNTLLLHVVGPLAQEKGVPLIALAHSMGAHILLRSLAGNPRRFACAAMIAPLLAIDTGDYSPEFTERMTFLYNLRKPSTAFVTGYEERDPLEISFEQNKVTSDAGRYERTRDLLKAQPFLRVNGPTFGWLGAAFRSMRRLQRRDFAEGITTPLLVFGAGKDRVVKTQAIRDYVKRLPNVRYVEIAEAEHEILMETDAIRAQFWSEFDAFVDAKLAAPQAFFTSSKS